jgi:hypothetical protein
MTEVTQTKQNSLLRTKIWTGIPCTCHEPNAPTHWSGRGGEASLLQACSQKLANLQKQKHDPVDRSRKPNKKQGAARRLHRVSISDTSAGEDTKKNEVMERIRESGRYTSQVVLCYVCICCVMCVVCFVFWRAEALILTQTLGFLAEVFC